MRKFSKGYFLAMFVMALLMAAVTLVGSVFLIIAVIVPMFTPGYGIWILPILFLILILGIEATFSIFLIKASKLFIKAKSMTDEELIENRKKILGYGIFLTVLYGATLLGLIALIICMVLTNNFIKKLENGEYKESTESFGTKIKNGSKKVVEGAKDVFGIKSKSEKLRESIEELKALKDEGIITEEEYNAKRSDLVSKL